MFLHVLADFLQITDPLFITADHFPTSQAAAFSVHFNIV